MEFIVFIFIALGVVFLTVLVFVGWFIISILRTAMYGIVSPRHAFGAYGPAGSAMCDNPRCRASNPSGARFCRRCGHEFASSSSARFRRAAMW